MSGDPMLLAAGLVDILEEMFGAAKGLIVMAMILVAMVFVIMTWMRTRSLVPTLGALVLGALVVWGVNSFDWFANRVGTDVREFNDDANTNTGNVDTGIDRRPGDG